MQDFVHQQYHKVIKLTILYTSCIQLRPNNIPWKICWSTKTDPWKENNSEQQKYGPLQSWRKTKSEAFAKMIGESFELTKVRKKWVGVGVSKWKCSWVDRCKHQIKLLMVCLCYSSHSHLVENAVSGSWVFSTSILPLQILFRLTKIKPSRMNSYLREWSLGCWLWGNELRSSSKDFQEILPGIWSWLRVKGGEDSESIMEIVGDFPLTIVTWKKTFTGKTTRMMESTSPPEKKKKKTRWSFGTPKKCFNLKKALSYSSRNLCGLLAGLLYWKILFFDDMSHEILDSKVCKGIQVHTKSDKIQEAFWIIFFSFFSNKKGA